MTIPQPNLCPQHKVDTAPMTQRNTLLGTVHMMFFRSLVVPFRRCSWSTVLCFRSNTYPAGTLHNLNLPQTRTSLDGKSHNWSVFRPECSVLGMSHISLIPSLNTSQEHNSRKNLNCWSKKSRPHTSYKTCRLTQNQDHKIRTRPLQCDSRPEALACRERNFHRTSVAVLGAASALALGAALLIHLGPLTP